MQDPHGSITPSPLDNMRGLEYYLHDVMHNSTANHHDVGHHQQHEQSARGDAINACLIYSYYVVYKIL